MRGAGMLLQALGKECPAPWRVIVATTLLLSTSLLLISCSGPSETHSTANEAQPPAAAKTPPPPDVATAAQIVASSPEFGEFEFTNASFSLPLKESMMNEPARAAAKDLVDAGWIVMSGGDVALGTKANGDRRFLIRPNGFVDLVPLAKKEFLGVHALKPQPDGTVNAEFTWKWIPNDIAVSFRGGELKSRFEGERAAAATLMWDGSAWTVLRITKQSA
jgi:hypothetical protein